MSRYDRDENPNETFNSIGHSDNRRTVEQDLRHDVSNAGGQGSGGSQSQEQPPISRSVEKEHEDFHQRRSKHLAPDRSRSYTLRDSELRTLTDIGTFRTLKRDDL